MIRKLAAILAVFIFSLSVTGQKRSVKSKPVARLTEDIPVTILKAEDARNFETLTSLLNSPSDAVRVRAAVAAGRIGDESAIPVLSKFAGDSSIEVQTAAMFAIGEIESTSGANVILAVLSDPKSADPVRARAVEAAGKIAAANPKDENYKRLGEAILDTLAAEDLKGARQNREVVLLAITAALRAKPDEAGVVVAKYLTNLDARIRSDAANTLARLRAKNANAALRAMLKSDPDANARANAARALSAAEDKESLALMMEAAVGDVDARVRVSAIRGVGILGDKQSGERLIQRGNELLGGSGARLPKPESKNELLEIAVVLGRLLAASRDAAAEAFLSKFSALDDGRSAEISIARLRISPGRFAGNGKSLTNWHQYSTLAQVMGEFAVLKADTDEAKRMVGEAPAMLERIIDGYLSDDRSTVVNQEIYYVLAAPDFLRAYARFKTADLDDVLRRALIHSDAVVRSTAADLIGDLPASPENTAALTTAFAQALVTDKVYNDAQLSMLDALFKLDKKAAAGVMGAAVEHHDYLVRRKAIELLRDETAWKDVPAATMNELRRVAADRKNTMWPYDPKSDTKLGQVLNTGADYRRALARKNGTVKAVLRTAKGTFTIDFYPEEAPLTVDNFVKLARSGYFDGLEVHRVVPNFVMQDGDPRGDGNGGPGWSIRCEINMLEYSRGAVGMALSGKDTGGSQWFVTHAPQPHLDGGYTVFGRVSERDMRVVDNIVRGDRILSVRIMDGPSSRRSSKRAGE